jgi:hypothetical protein
MNVLLHKRPTRLKNLKVTEVSSVDRGAGEGVKVMLHKSADDAQAEITKGFNALHESVASILSDDGDFDKYDAVAETMGQAEEYFTKLLDPTDDDHNVVDGDDADYPAEQGRDDAKRRKTSMDEPVPALTKLNKMAEAEVATHPKLSFAKAYVKVLTDPANRDLAMQERRAPQHRHRQARRR